MSGIVATFDVGQAATVAALTDMLAQHLSHRGPDGVGVEVCGRSVVANARLAIIDVVGGQHRECVRLLFGLHALTLQRVDRMTMARGIEARVPFLDVAFVDWAMGLSPKLKLRHSRGLEKELLRQAAGRLLPSELVTRPKLEPVRGTSTDVVLEQYADAQISDRDLALAAVRFPVDTPRTKEELLYRLIFDDLFPGEAARGTVARSRVPISEALLS